MVGLHSEEQPEYEYKGNNNQEHKHLINSRPFVCVAYHLKKLHGECVSTTCKDKREAGVSIIAS